MNASNPAYARTFGSAVHEELFALIRVEQRQGRLLNLITNTGRPSGTAFPNSFALGARGRNIPPDIRMSLGGGQEAIWDLTTIPQASVPGGHVGTYAGQNFVQYAGDLVYQR
jgi:hypothetical protein